MNTPLEWYALSAVILFAKMLAISLFQGYHRIGKGHFRNPEDAAFSRRQPAAEELPQVQRAARAWSNDLENIPIFLLLGIAYVMLGAPAASAPWLFGIFVAARIAHTVSYLAALQPWRTLAYSIGMGCTIGLCVGIVGVLC